jgi:hypothetical protein
MPLHADEKLRPVTRKRNRLDYAVLRISDRLQRWSKLTDSLVVKGVDWQRFFPGKIVQQRARYERNRVGIRVARQPGFFQLVMWKYIAGTQLVMDILDERSAKHDVCDLHSATYREHGEITLERMFHQREFECISFKIDINVCKVFISAIIACMNVAAAAKNEAMQLQTVYDAARIHIFSKQNRFRPGTLDGNAVARYLQIVG